MVNDVHCHQQRVFGVGALERLADILARGRLEADDRIDLGCASSAQVVARLIHGQAGISLHIEDLDNLDAGIVCERILIPLQPLVKVGLAGHSEENNVPLAVQLCSDARSAQPPCLPIVGADKKQPVTRRRIRVNCHHRNARVNSCVDLRLHQLLIGDGDEDPRRLQCHHLAELSHLVLRIEPIRSAHIDGDSILVRSLLESRPR
jgi:hypothetical protein